jgi:ectoine hydroxylase-related dioxygenase (phytanoyl-CoA dioxygenase family)
MRALAGELVIEPGLRSRAGARHILHLPPIARLAGDIRLMRIAARWLGGDTVPFKATLFEKSGEANWLAAWHQDTALPLERRTEVSDWGPWSEKYGVNYAHAPARALERIIALRVHLDDSTADNGPLRVLPGTHSEGVLSDAQVHERSLRESPVTCCVASGGVVAMRPLIIHASSKSANHAPRRVLHIEYCASIELEHGLRLRAA